MKERSSVLHKKLMKVRQQRTVNVQNTGIPVYTLYFVEVIVHAVNEEPIALI
jgi:hypothetical protein